MRVPSERGDGATARPSDFDRRIYREVARIPRGRVSTYARIGRLAGCPSPRAVGGALGRNPFAPGVPCHRVVASDLRPGGFLGCRRGPAVAEKLRRLAGEGVFFVGNRLADPERLWP